MGFSIRLGRLAASNSSIPDTTASDIVSEGVTVRRMLNPTPKCGGCGEFIIYTKLATSWMIAFHVV